MSYNAKNAKEVVLELKPNTQGKGVIINIEDGRVREFIKEGVKWNGDEEKRCINLWIEIKHESKTYTIKKIFTYDNDEEGNTLYSPNSNLAQYKKVYGKLPEISDVVNVMTDIRGYWRLIT